MKTRSKLILATTIAALITTPMCFMASDGDAVSTPGGGSATATEVDLKNIDYCIVMDKSGSMGTPEGTYKSRFAAALETCQGIARTFGALDADGISGGTFGSTTNISDSITAETFISNMNGVMLGGGTLIMPLLDAVFTRARQSMAKGRQFLCHIIWDGAPNELDNASTLQAQLDAIGKKIADFTKEMTSDGQVAIQFLQVGTETDKEQAAKIESFTTMLDDHLVSKYGAAYDIIDVKPYGWIAEQGTAQAVGNEAFNG